MFIRKNVVDRKGLNYIENFDGTVRVVPEGESVFASHDEFEDEAEETSRAAREYAEQASSIRA